MDNTIIIPRGTESYKLAFAMGMLIGLGIDYRVNRGSQVYMATNERRRERNLNKDVQKSYLELEEIRDGCKVFNGKGLTDSNVDFKVVNLG